MGVPSQQFMLYGILPEGFRPGFFSKVDSGFVGSVQTCILFEVTACGFPQGVAKKP